MLCRLSRGDLLRRCGFCGQGTGGKGVASFRFSPTLQASSTASIHPRSRSSARGSSHPSDSSARRLLNGTTRASAMAQDLPPIGGYNPIQYKVFLPHPILDYSFYISTPPSTSILPTSPFTSFQLLSQSTI